MRDRGDTPAMIVAIKAKAIAPITMSSSRRRVRSSMNMATCSRGAGEIRVQKLLASAVSRGFDDSRCQSRVVFGTPRAGATRSSHHARSTFTGGYSASAQTAIALTLQGVFSELVPETIQRSRVRLGALVRSRTVGPPQKYK